MEFPNPVGWMAAMFWWLGQLAIYLGALLAATGCASPAVKGFPAEFGQAAGVIVTSVADQALWKNITANLGGQVIEPGFEGYAGMLYIAGGRIRGFSGQVGLNAQADGTGAITPETRAAILAYLNGDERYRDWLVRLFSGSAGASPSQPTSGPGVGTRDQGLGSRDPGPGPQAPSP